MLKMIALSVYPLHPSFCSLYSEDYNLTAFVVIKLQKSPKIFRHAVSTNQTHDMRDADDQLTLFFYLV